MVKIGKETIKKIELKIREIRENQNLTIMQLADKLNIEYNNLIRIEKGRTNPTIGTLLKICEALDVKLSDLINIE